MPVVMSAPAAVVDVYLPFTSRYAKLFRNTDVTGTATINNVTGTATINNVTGTATINNVTGTATINNVAGTATINNVAGTATINNIARTATINNIARTATINNIARTATINNIARTATINNATTNIATTNIATTNIATTNNATTNNATTNIATINNATINNATINNATATTINNATAVSGVETGGPVEPYHCFCGDDGIVRTEEALAVGAVGGQDARVLQRRDVLPEYVRPRHVREPVGRYGIVQVVGTGHEGRHLPASGLPGGAVPQRIQPAPHGDAQVKHGLHKSGVRLVGIDIGERSMARRLGIEEARYPQRHLPALHGPDAIPERA